MLDVRVSTPALLNFFFVQNCRKTERFSAANYWQQQIILKNKFEESEYQN
jgi:hypothetical protein